MSAEFYYPERGLGFFVILILIFFILRSHKLRKLFSLNLQTNKSLDRSATFHAPKNRIIKEILFVLAISFVTLSLMRPRWGEKERTRKIQSVDVCIAIDLSQSMLAEDMSPNRLRFAKQEITLLLEALGDYRVSLVGFAGGAFIAAPLTNDLDAVADLLSPLNTDYVSMPSTLIESALITCGESFGYTDIRVKNEEEEDGKESAGVILLVTDGDDREEIDSDIIKGLKRRKITVSSYLVGKETPAQIPIRDSMGTIAGFVKDPETQAAAATRVETKLSETLAKETGAKTYIAHEIGNFSDVFKEDLKKFEAKAREDGVEVEKEEQFQIPLLIALFLLFIECLLTETGGLWPLLKKKYFHFIWIGALLSSPANALGIIDSLTNNFGVFLFEKGYHQKASELFEKNIENSPDNKLFVYNWASARLHKIEKDMAQLIADGKATPESISSSPSAREAMELSQMIQKILDEEKDPLWRKKWLFQNANALELSGKNSDAINSYYDTQDGPQESTLDTAAKHNLARLLRKNSQSGGGGQGDSGGAGGEGKSGGADPNQQNENSKSQQPQDYKGQNFTPEQVKQILENVGSEERNVMKKKSKEESQKRSKEFGEGQSNAKPW